MKKIKKQIIFGIIVIFILLLSSSGFARFSIENNKEIESPVLDIIKDNTTNNTDETNQNQRNLIIKQQRTPIDDPIFPAVDLFITWTLNNSLDGTPAGKYSSCNINYNFAHFYMKSDPSLYTETKFNMNTNFVSASTSTDNRVIGWDYGDTVYAYMENNGESGNGCYHPEIEIYVDEQSEIRINEMKCAILVWEPNITIHDSCWMQVPYNYSITATLTNDVMKQIPTINISSGYSKTLNLSSYNTHNEIIQFPYNISLKENYTSSFGVYTDDLPQQNVCNQCAENITSTTDLNTSASQLFQQHYIVFNSSNSTFNRWRKIFFNTNITNLNYSCYSNNQNITTTLFDRDKLNISAVSGWEGISTVYCNLTDGSYIEQFSFDVNTTLYDVSVYGLSPVLIEDNLLVNNKSYFRFYVYNNGSTEVNDIGWKFDTNGTQGWIFSPYNLTIKPKQEQVVYLYTIYNHTGEHYPKIYLDYKNKYLETNETNNNDNLTVLITESVVPTVDIISPNQATYNSSQILVNISATDNFGVVETWFKINNGENITYNESSLNYIELAPGTYTLYAYARDASNNIGEDNFSFTVDFNTSFRNDLMAYYNFDNNANDQIGTLDGTLYGDTTLSTGKLNNSYYFDGDGDYIQLPDDVFVFDLNTSKITSVSLWIKPKNSGALIGKYEDSSASGTSSRSLWGISYSNSTPGVRIETGMRSGTVNLGAPDNNLFSINKKSDWIQVVVVFDLVNLNGYDGTSYLYIDGEFVSSAPITYASYYDAKDINPNNPLIGAFDYYDIGAISNFFKGKIDEVGFWNRSLTQEEIKVLYNEGLGYSPLNEPLNSPKKPELRIDMK